MVFRVRELMATKMIVEKFLPYINKMYAKAEIFLRSEFFTHAWTKSFFQRVLCRGMYYIIIVCAVFLKQFMELFLTS